MKICQTHWEALKVAIDERGLSKFIAQSGTEAAKRIEGQLKGQTDATTFDPLLNANFVIMGNAVSIGGLYLMTGELCPMCESEAHNSHPAEWWINHAADDQLALARELKLVPGDQ